MHPRRRRPAGGLACLDVTFFECGDPSPLCVVSRFLELPRASQETSKSGEGSPHSKRVTTKQGKRKSGEGSPQSITAIPKQGRPPCGPFPQTLSTLRNTPLLSPP